MCKKCNKHNVAGMKAIKGYQVERLAAIGGGAVAAEFAINSMVNNLTKDGKMPYFKKKGVPGALKIALGIGAMTMSKNKTVQDAGLGAVAAGGLDVARAFLSIPSVAGIEGVYSTEDQVGVVIDLDQVSGPMSPEDEDDY